MEKSTKIKWSTEILEKTYEEVGKEIKKPAFEKVVRAVTGNYPHMLYTETRNLREYVEALGDCMECTRGRYPSYKYVRSKEDCLKQIETIKESRVGVKRTTSSSKLDVFNIINFFYKCEKPMVLYETLREAGYNPSESWANSVVEKAAEYGAHIRLTSSHTGVDIVERGKKRHLTKWVITRDNLDVLKEALFVLGESLKADGITVDYPIVKKVGSDDSYEKRVDEVKQSLGAGYGSEETRELIAKTIVAGEGLKPAPTTDDLVVMLFVSLDEATQIEKLISRDNYSEWVGDNDVLMKLTLNSENLIKVSTILGSKELLKLVPADDAESIKAISEAVLKAQKIEEFNRKREELLKKKEEIEYEILLLEETMGTENI